MSGRLSRGVVQGRQHGGWKPTALQQPGLVRGEVGPDIGVAVLVDCGGRPSGRRRGRCGSGAGSSGRIVVVSAASGDGRGGPRRHGEEPVERSPAGLALVPDPVGGGPKLLLVGGLWLALPELGEAAEAGGLLAGGHAGPGGRPDSLEPLDAEPEPDLDPQLAEVVGGQELVPGELLDELGVRQGR
jgi:hypothetical protein